MNIKHNQKESLSVRFLYKTVPGRGVLKLLTLRPVSDLCGRCLDSKASKVLIQRFVRKNKIDLDEYCQTDFHTFNEFFTRKIKAEKRPVEQDPSALIAPCDGLLSAYRIVDDLVVPVKQSAYTVSDLLGGDPIARKYKNGVCLVFRLCVDHYHRYCFVDDGIKGESVFLPGRLHTVRPIALEKFPVFTQNSREYTVIKTENFGDVIQIEVGALLVGKIKNHPVCKSIKRGQEKGMFLYGGSTVILLLEKDRAVLPDAVFRATGAQTETPVKMGMRIGSKLPLL